MAHGDFTRGQRTDASRLPSMPWRKMFRAAAVVSNAFPVGARAEFRGSPAILTMELLCI
jgi:hypothetical protein